MSAKLLDKDKIKALQELVADFPDYTMGDHSFKGAGLNVATELDHICNSTTDYVLQATKGSLTHLQPDFRTGDGLLLASDMLQYELKPVAASIQPISIKPKTPSMKQAKEGLAAGWGLFNPDDSYGQHARLVIEKAADALGVESPEQVNKRPAKGKLF